MNTSNIKLACVVTTYDRIDDVKALMDIIREMWAPHFEKIDIYHTYNGKPEDYPKKYREDMLHVLPTKPHLAGAINLINQGVADVVGSGKDYDFIVVMSGDTWIYDEQKMVDIISDCLEQKAQLAATIWNGPYFATEFFVMTPKLAKKVFPVQYEKLVRSLGLYDFSEMIATKFSNNVSIETMFTFNILWALKGFNGIYLIPGRKAMRNYNRFYSPDFYSSHHDLVERKKMILPKLKTFIEKNKQKVPELHKLLS